MTPNKAARVPRPADGSRPLTADVRNKMMKSITSRLVIALSLGWIITSSAVMLRIDGGQFGLIAISAPSPTNAISIRILDKHGGEYLDLQDESITCTLTVAPDGAIHTLSIEGKGRYDIDIASRYTDATNGTVIQNPMAELSGKTNDLLTIWRQLTALDKRFMIMKLE